MKLIHDDEIEYAFAQEFNSTNWVTVKSKWSEFVERLSKSKKTSETAKQYAKLDSAEKNKIKAVGGFVGGVFAGPSRTKNTLLFRTMLTLDIDTGAFDIETFKMMYDFASVIYSTHSHTLETPSYRIVIPLLTTVDGDQFEYIARKITTSLGGKEFFCKTSYVRHQLMYLPSHPSDIEPVFEVQDGLWLDPAEYLVGDWQDMSQWTLDDMQAHIKKQADPLLKKGPVGVFCRTYDIHQAIAKFIPDYEQSDFNKDVYTYLKGSTANGVKTYDDKFSYSHHSTDPSSGTTTNAFDLVRIHKFAELDENIKDKTAGNKTPSYKAMIELMDNDRSCKIAYIREKDAQAKMEFSEEKYVDETGEVVGKDEPKKRPKKSKEKTDQADNEWQGSLQVEHGMVLPTRDNIVLILMHDKELKGNFRFDDFAKRAMVVHLPWRKVDQFSSELESTDLANLRHYIEKVYGIDNVNKIKDAMDIVLKRNKFHPIKEYFDTLKWDGVERLESVFIDYLGADDSEYTRTVTKKQLVAAVARIYHPGIKFDTMLVFLGSQGKGKSWVVGKLGGKWFSDTMGSLHSKEAMENLQGIWLLEIPELSQFKRSDIETVKAFISKREDRFRVPYTEMSSNFPRQCVFFGTTNDMDFLQDQTGNRRFWPIDITGRKAPKNVFTDLTQEIVDQIWAEAFESFMCGEQLFLDEQMEFEAKLVQDNHTVQNPQEERILAYLETPLPEEWNEMELAERRQWLTFQDPMQSKGVKVREMVCVHEIWSEVMGEPLGKMNGFNTRFIHAFMRKQDSWKQLKGKAEVSGHGMVRVYVRGNQLSEFSVYRDLIK